MHELSLCRNMIDILKEEAVARHFSRVKTVWVEIGELSCVDAEALSFGFLAASQGTLAEGACLEIERVAGGAWCAACSENVSVSQRYDPCPRCGGHQLQYTSGEEMRVRELEVD